MKKWHYLFLAHIKRFLHESRALDLSPKQALIVYCVGQRPIKVKDVVLDHFYEGCNPSYILKKMVTLGYLAARPCDQDRRVVYLSLGIKGTQVCHLMDSFFSLYHEAILAHGLSGSQFPQWITQGLCLETLWRNLFLPPR